MIRVSYEMQDGLPINIQRRLGSYKPKPGELLADIPTLDAPASAIVEAIVEHLAEPAAFAALKEAKKDADEYAALREEALQYFMRGEAMPADKVARVRALEAKRAVKVA